MTVPPPTPQPPPPPPPLDKPPSRTGSAFSRFANIVPNPLSGSSASSGSIASSSSSASPLPPPASALDALEALASADHSGRLRHASVDSTRQRAADKSRSRERSEPRMVAYDSPNAYIQGRMSGSVSGSYWGMESLPPNAIGGGGGGAGGSSFSSFAPGTSSSLNNNLSAFQDNGSHFFPPGSAFSFEASLAESVRSLGGSPSLFNARLNAPDLLLPQSTTPEPSASSFYNNSPWEPSSAGAAARLRSESLLGGGRKPNEASRALRYSVNTIARDRGLVAFDKPRDGGTGRVVVAGRTCLKVLKVPSGVPRRVNEPSTASFKSSTSIAQRRSRSRGAASDTNSGEDRAAERRAEREEVTETLDVRNGSRLGPAFLFTDVGWGQGATSNKVATSFTNGAVVLWDLEKDGASKVDQLKFEHDRAVNRVVFGGQSGSWLMSGGQDGHMKLWDVRDSRPSNLMLKASSPVRHLAFSPSSAQPFILVAACASGTLIRYDLRQTGRQHGGAVDRIAGHVGSCLAMDWRDSFDGERLDTAGGNREGGWVVTGGLDKTIKVWDFSLATLSTKPVRTLRTSQPVQTVTWHPTRATEIASSPLALLSVDGADDLPPATPTAEGAATAAKDPSSSSWRNEIEVWDTRRPFFPKYSIKADEPTASVLYNDDATIWSLSKTSPLFMQHDVSSDSYALLDIFERAGGAWSGDGSMLFVDDGRSSTDIPFDHKPMAERSVADATVFQPDISASAIPSFDPDFSFPVFSYLANSLVVTGEFGDVCEINAEVSMIAGRSDASQLWSTLKIWLDEERAVLDESALDAETNPPPSTASQGDNITEPPSTQAGYRFGLSRIPSRRPSNSSAKQTPIESKTPLDYFSEESTSSETDVAEPSRTGYSYYPDLSSASSDSDHHHFNGRPRNHSAGGGVAVHKLVSSLTALKTGTTHRRSRSSTIAGGETPLRDADDPNLDSQLSRGNSISRLRSRRASSSSGADTDGESEQVFKRARAAKLQAVQAAAKSRRASSGGASDHRRPTFSRDSMLAKTSRRSSHDAGVNMSRRSSLPFQHIRGDRSGSVGVETGRPPPAGPSPRELHEKAGRSNTLEATEIVKERIKATLQEYADQGDLQLCATVCCVLKDKGLSLDPFFVARVTKAYLDLLRGLNLHAAAAGVNKYCATPSLRGLTQNTVVFHAACGRCQKALDQPPYGYCSRCKLTTTRCCICHLAIRSLILWCTSCGHAAHPDCMLASTADASSHMPSPFGALSLPSTPGIGTPLRRWLWGEDDGEGSGVERGAHSTTDKTGCPVGTCGHTMDCLPLLQ